MTRSYGSKPRKASRITQPIRVARRPRDASITPLGFTCFRLVRVFDARAPFTAVELQHSTNTMFVFVTAGEPAYARRAS